MAGRPPGRGAGAQARFRDYFLVILLLGVLS
jgi:hypothetical protein